MMRAKSWPPDDGEHTQPLSLCSFWTLCLLKFNCTVLVLRPSVSCYREEWVREILCLPSRSFKINSDHTDRNTQWPLDKVPMKISTQDFPFIQAMEPVSPESCMFILGRFQGKLSPSWRNFKKSWKAARDGVYLPRNGTRWRGGGKHISEWRDSECSRLFNHFEKKQKHTYGESAIVWRLQTEGLNID